MRTLTPVETDRLKILTANNIAVTLLEPTSTGLSKSIMDATGPVRLFLKSGGIHDYDMQVQGPENKVKLRAYLIQPDALVVSEASLYRPITKKGDPRIWFSKLKEYVKPNEIIGIIIFQDNLYLINLTRINLNNLIYTDFPNPLKEIIDEINSTTNEIAIELLEKIKDIARRGFIPSLLNADTAIGRTLEHELGIVINSSKKPDYKGIELKSFRDKRANRKNLFAQVADWRVSKFKSSAEILNNFGYWREADFKLYCTISTITKNSQGLKFKLNDEEHELIENSDKPHIGDFAIWRLEKLHQRLLEKHNETFWVSALSKRINGNEFFQFNKVEHTMKPIVSQFDILLDQGIITMDHLIKRDNLGNVVEKGPLFKIRPNSLDLLFPPSKSYSLV